MARWFARLRWPTMVVGGLVLLLFILLHAGPAETHGSPIIDGAFTGDWCAPAFKGAFGPDSFTVLTPGGPPPGCALGTEFFWDDWDALFYGGGMAADTMGWLVGGAPGAPLTDLETDLDFFATTADINSVFYAVSLGIFPSMTGIPPHAQIAIDLDGPAGGNPFWYDPLPSGTGGLALAVGLFPDYLITTDVVANVGYLWEATTAPGAWTLVGPVPLGWSGFSGVPPGVIEIAVPWAMFAPGPPFGPGIPAFMTVMTAHGAPFAGPSDAPMTPEDDVFTEIGAGFTTSPDICPPGPPSTDCELFAGPGGGGGSADAFVNVIYPIPNTPTPTATSTATNTATPTATSTATSTATPTITPTATVTGTPTITPTATATITGTPPTATPTSTGTPPTSTSTPTVGTPTATPIPTRYHFQPIMLNG